MENVIVLEDIVSGDGTRIIHLMSNFELTLDDLKIYVAPIDAHVEIKKEIGVYHLRASWPMRGPLEVCCAGWPVPMIFVVWNLAGCESVTTAIRSAAQHYQDIFGERPGYAYMRTMPKGREPGVEVDDLMLFDAEWMVSKCVAVGWQCK